MRMMRRMRAAALGLCLAGAASVGGAALAQEAFPTRPIRLITLTTPGGSLDLLARLIADELSKQFGQQVVVENRVGAGGNIGAQAVARSDADGYTIGMVTVSTHGINPTLYGKSQRFDPVADFAPITHAADIKNVLVVHPSVPAKTAPELVAYAKANPDKVSFGSAGVGTSQHMAGELLKLVSGAPIQHVPYRGAAAAMPDLLAGRIQMMFVSIPDVREHIRSGALRALAVSARTRAQALPDTPTMIEQGFADFDVTAWFGVVAPANTPAAIVTKYNEAIVAMLRRADVREKLAPLGFDVVGSTPDAFAAHIKAEVARWAPVVRASGAKVE